MVLCKASLCDDVEDIQVKFTLSASIYPIDHFDEKFKVTAFQHRKGWQTLHIKNIKLVIPEPYTYMTSNSSF